MKFSVVTISTMVVMTTLPSSVTAFSTLPSVASKTTTTTTRLAATTETTTGVARNPNFAKLSGGYLFPEIGRRRTEYLKDHPEQASRIISLGIGDTTQPIPTHILNGLVQGASKLGVKETYTGYGAEQGMTVLREKIASVLYKDTVVTANDIFVSDGAKCDIMRLQNMFGSQLVTAVQDPSYPVYVDTAVMMGQTGTQNADTKQYSNIVYMPCTAENGFFPDYASLPRADVVYLCSPNNPTGAAATREQLADMVKLCQERGSILVFDAAYAPFIRDPAVPKSVFEIPGAETVAIEVNSFSKYAGFTGVRLGWTVVPAALKYSDGTPVRNDWNRVMTTGFNGASNIVQAGGLACLDEDGMKEIDTLIDYYLENAKLLRECFTRIGNGWEVYGGVNAPYIFARLPAKMGGSWDAFQTILETCQVVTIPGAGFGPGGEGYLRLSAFAPRDSVVEACQRLEAAFGSK